MDDSIINYSRQWFGATNIMTMGRSQMAKQVTNPPRKKKWSAKRKRKINCKRPKGLSGPIALPIEDKAPDIGPFPFIILYAGEKVSNNLPIFFF